MGPSRQLFKQLSKDFSIQHTENNDSTHISLALHKRYGIRFRVAINTKKTNAPLRELIEQAVDSSVSSKNIF